ncbi:MAG: ABC transporter substrate-binding protein [Lachnospiraceae bacterium]|nr:ABC transporter substrate-binding protein [Lachnospiraceae bacterium]
MVSVSLSLWACGTGTQGGTAVSEEESADGVGAEAGEESADGADEEAGEDASADGADAEGGEDSSAKDAASKEEITFVLDWTPNTNHTGIYEAIEKGYYADEGLEVSVVQPPDDGAEMLVGSGRAEFGVSFQDTLASALVGDYALPIQAVAAIEQHNTSGVLSREGEGITSPAKLEGKKYATWGLPIENAMMQNVLKADGGDFDKVEVIPTTVTDEASALSSHTYDAIWVYYGWAGIGCNVAGVPTDFWAFKDVNPVFDYYTPVLIANNTFLEEHPDTAKAFLRATAKGYEDAASDPEEAAEILMKENPELADNPELVNQSQEYLSKEYISDADRWGVFDADRWNAFYQWLNENDLVDEKIPEDFGFTNEYLPE